MRSQHHKVTCNKIIFGYGRIFCVHHFNLFKKKTLKMMKFHYSIISWIDLADCFHFCGHTVGAPIDYMSEKMYRALKFSFPRLINKGFSA